MTSKKSVLFETPVAYPLIGDCDRDDAAVTAAAVTAAAVVEVPVYIVNDHDGTIRRASIADNEDGGTARLFPTFACDDVLSMMGLSSVSEISYGTSSSSGSKNESKKPAIVTTSPVADRILAITRILPDDDHQEPLVVYLDLTRECSIFTESVVAVKAFSCDERGSAMQLVLVDAAGVVLTLRFTLDTLTPIAVPRRGPGGGSGRNMKPIDVRCFVPAAQLAVTMTGGSTATTATEQFAASTLASPTVSSTMVAFVSPDVVLLALNPYFLAVDLLNERVHSWSQSLCVEDMRARSSGLRTLWQKSAEYLLGGKWDAIVVDMEPVAAVCVVENDPLQLQSLQQQQQRSVFTLHADGAVRHWTMTPHTSLAPYTVRNVSLVQKYLPDPALWSIDTLHRSYLTARHYETVLVVCVHVQAEVALSSPPPSVGPLGEMEDMQDDDDAPSVTSSGHVIIAVDVPAEPDDEAAYVQATHAIQLTVPIVSTTSSCLVDMQFDAQSDSCRMRALFLVADPVSPTFSQSVLCTYEPNLLAILSREPSVLNSDMMLDGVARHEREHISSLSFLSETLPPTTEQEKETTGIEIDRQFMTYLFSPIFPRGNGTVLAPKPSHIRRAMHMLVPSFPQSAGLDRDDIAVDLMNLFDEWKKQSQRSMTHSSPVKRHRSAHESTTATPSATRTPYSSLDMVVVTTDEAQDVDEMDVNNDGGTTSLRDIQQELMEREHFWRTLLLSIAQQEQLERIPVAMKIVSSSSLSADAAVIVRPCCVCSLTCTRAMNDRRQPALSELDEKVLAVLDILSRDKSSLLQLKNVERRIQSTVLKGELATNPTAANDFMALLASSKLLGRDEDCVKLTRQLKNVHEGQWKALLRNSTLLSSLPGLCLFSESWPKMMDSSNSSPRQPAMGIHTRLAAGSILSQTMNSISRLYLARWIIVSEMKLSAETKVFALRMYLHSIAVIGVAAQTTKHVRSTSFETSTLTMPPKKRSKMSSAVYTNEILVSDSLLLNASQSLSDEFLYHWSIAASSVSLARAAIAKCFQFESIPTLDGREQALVELGVLSLPAGNIGEPGLTLRLLAIPNALRLPDDSVEVVSRRERKLAQCLVLLSRCKPSDEASKMLDKAFGLLPFDVACMDKSIDNLRTLEKRVVGNALGGQRFVDYVNQAIDLCRRAELAVDDETFERLFSALFSATISIQVWPQAYKAALEYPVAERKLEQYERLVRAMVDAGALKDLLQMCAELARSDAAIQNVVYFPGIVADTLQKLGNRDMYATRNREASPDYSGALFSLRVSLNQWKRASETMDLRYVHARQALKAETKDLSDDQRKFRLCWIVDDMVLAAATSYSMMSMEPDPNERYLLSGNRAGDSSIPYDYRRETSGNGQHLGTKAPAQYMSLMDLELRAVRVKVLKALFADSNSDDVARLDALANEGFESLAFDSELCDQLFMRGFYVDGLLLARTMDKFRACMPNGRGMFHGGVSRLIRQYLLPLALDSDCMPERPTLFQLEDALESLKTDPLQESRTRIRGTRSKKLSDTVRADIRIGAMYFIRQLTVKYTSAMEPIAVEVAKEFLAPHRAATPLPLWLESLLLWGTLPEEDLPGLFSRRRTLNTPEGYLGNPIALLDVYTLSGLLGDACRVVTAVLSNNNYRAHVATSRRPEKGEIDDLPEKKIDLLWNLIDGRLNAHRIVGSDRDKVLRARTEMEIALEKHFDLMEISEKGLPSARALS